MLRRPLAGHMEPSGRFQAVSIRSIIEVLAIDNDYSRWIVQSTKTFPVPREFEIYSAFVNRTLGTITALTSLLFVSMLKVRFGIVAFTFDLRFLYVFASY